MRRTDKTSAGRRTALAATLAAAIGAIGLAGSAGAESAVPTADLPPLPEAETWTDHGVASELTAEKGAVRVRVLLCSQPLLEAASADRFQSLLDSGLGQRAAGGTGRITAPERAVARASETGFERAVAGLEEESARSARDLAQVAAGIERGGGEILEHELLPAAVVARVDARLLSGLADLEGVQSVEPARIEEPLSDVSVPAAGAPSWWAAGFTGGTGPSDQAPIGDALGVDVALQGEAPDSTHPAFLNLVTIDNSPQEDPEDHGAHVAGIIASNDTTYRGVAYGVDRLIGADDSEYALGLTDYQGNLGASDPAEAINRSFGSFAVDDNENSDVDVITQLFGLARAEAAGNDNTTGAPTVGNIGRNYLNVGAFNDNNTTTPTDDVVLGDSSRGPTPGGRKKPDLVAPGGSIMAPDAQWNTPPASPDFTGMSGTSFSTPHVAGALTLLEGAGISDGTAQRAILINSARDWNSVVPVGAGWTAPQTGWRPEVGWGSLDLTTALSQRNNYRLGDVAEGEAAYFRATVPAGAKATMAFELRGFWPNYPQLGSQPITYTQSNLDLHQYEADGDEILPPAPFDPPNTMINPGPDAVDPNDTVEQVRTPTAQAITYKVEAASQVDGAAAEPFALAAATPLTELEAPVTRPTGAAASPAGAVACNQPVTIATQLVNDSPDLESTASAVELVLPAGVELAPGSQPLTQTVAGGVLETSSTSEQKTWTVRATSDGPKVLTIAGAGEGLGTMFRRTQTVTIDADCVPPETAVDQTPASPTNDSTPAFSFSATGGQTGFECSVDGGAFAPCSSPATTASLPDGPHTFAVRARDSVGNVDPSPASRTFAVDTSAPETSITGGPSGATKRNRPQFTLASSEASSFECSIDGGSFEACSASFQTHELEQGNHRFRARAVDSAGNVDSSPATQTFVVDRAVAKPRLRGKPRQRLEGGVTVSVRAAEPARVRVSGFARTDGGRIRTRQVRADLSGRGKIVAVALPFRQEQALASALEAGDRASILIRAIFTDDLGNTAVVKRRIGLR